MIGIIGAMDEEIYELKRIIDVKEEKKIYDVCFYIGTLNNKEVIGVLIKELILKHDDRDELDAKQDMEHLRDILIRNL